jgi:ABC-type multidrug transport system ATPase subunit
MSPDEKKGSAGEHSPLSPVDILEDSESTTATAVSEGKDPRGPPTLDKDRDAGGRTPGRSGDSSFINEVPEGHVSYRRAREEFAQLERKYSGLSQGSGELRRRTTTKSMSMSVGSALAGPSTTPSTETDIEAAAGAGEKIEDEFNLANELHSGRQLANDAGIKHKKVGVVWEDLEVIGAGGMKMHIRNFSNADIEQFILPPIKIMGLLGFKPFAPKPRTILHKTTGVLKPGEMCLVLGRPGSGCSTFLKTIANQRDSFMKVNGNVEYAGVHAKEMHKYYGGEVLYNQEDDDHLPTLTVGQTLRFALELKTPKKRIPGVSTTQYRDALLNLLLSMLNIKHTENTIVGNAHVRGVSGGERKRVSIAEQFCSGACLSSWDNSTRGLDASTALDYAKSLRLLTDIMNQTSFVSLYQAGEGIYDQFDKVLVLNEGYVVYFGSCKEARGYFVSLGFEDMPRQTTPDYLSGCTDPNERRYQEGCDTSNVPSTPEAMATAYQQSEIYRRMVAAKDEYKAQMEGDERDREQFRKAILEQKHRGVHHNSPYTVSLPAQIWAITKRQTILKFQDRFSIYSGYFTAIAISLIVGSVFYQLPLTSAGVFTRGGILFLGLLFNALTSFSELPTQMMGRPILFRQVGYRFYRPAAYAVAAVLSDIPYNSSNIFIFCIVLYFMGGLYSSAGAFFIFFLLIFTTFMVMSAFFRTIGVACGNYNVAARLASFTVSVFCTYTGYMIPLHSMKRWLFWISYTNPLYYG